MAGVAGLFACTSVAAGASVRSDRSTLSVRSGGMVTVAVEVRRAAQCTLSGAGVRASVPVPAQTGLAFSWYVDRARAGRYLLRLRCGRRVHRVRIRVHGRRNGARSLDGGPVSVLRTPLRRVRDRDPDEPLKSSAVDGAVPAPAPRPPGSPPPDPVKQAQEMYVTVKHQQLVQGDGMCQEYVIEEREEIYKALVMPLLEEWARHGFDPESTPELPADASSWKRIARSTPGVIVSDRPTPGAIIVMEPEESIRLNDGWSLIAEEPGHLAVVDSVDSVGGFKWSDMNGAGGPNVVWTYESPPGAGDGHTFISLAG